ncbi:MAG: ester cyclase [Acidobacteriota bacterium]
MDEKENVNQQQEDVKNLAKRELEEESKSTLVASRREFVSKVGGATLGTLTAGVVGIPLSIEKASAQNAQIGEIGQIGEIQEQNKTLMQYHFDESWNKSNLGAVDAVFDLDFVAHQPAGRKPILGPEGVKGLIKYFRGAFPDLQYVVEKRIAEGDMVATMWRMHGTHKGDFYGIAPTNKVVVLTGISINRFADGKTLEAWDQVDIMGLLQQLGVIKEPPVR